LPGLHLPDRVDRSRRRHRLRGPDLPWSGRNGRRTRPYTCGNGWPVHLRRGRPPRGIVSGAGMAQIARAIVAEGGSPFLAARVAQKGVHAIEARDIAEGEDAGDEACRKIMERGRRAFAVACVGFVNALNPTRIVVGGAIADAQGDRLLGPARAEIAATAFRTPRSRVQIVHAELGADVGLAGGHPLVIARLGDPAWRGGRATPLPRTVDRARRRSLEEQHGSTRRYQWFRPDRPAVAQGILERAPELEVVAVNDIVDVPMNALLFATTPPTATSTAPSATRTTPSSSTARRSRSSRSRIRPFFPGRT